MIVGFGGVMGVATGVFATLVGSGLWAENRRHPLHVNVHLGEPGTRNGVPVIWVAGTDGAEANCSDYVNQ